MLLFLLFFIFTFNNINERNSILYFICVLFSFVLLVLFQPSTNILVVFKFGIPHSLDAVGACALPA